MKRIAYIIVLLIGIFYSSCNQKQTENKYIKKVELNNETIAVGIYKATGYEYPYVDFIAEAINIDGGIVYVSLTEADVLKTKLENIDVLIFPSMVNGQFVDKLDDEVAVIIKEFITKKGKGAIGICNGGGILSSSENCQSLDIINVDIKENTLNEFDSGLLKFRLTEEGKNIFPDLEDYPNLYIDYNHGQEIEILDTVSEIEVIAELASNEIQFPIIVTAKGEKGKIALLNVNPEITPGMRWVIPRLIRWSVNKEYVWYDKNVFRPDLFRAEVNIDDDLDAKLGNLLLILDSGNKNEIIKAMDDLQEIYPWIATEKIRNLLNQRNDDIKLRAAKYLVDNEYTLALEDIKNSIKEERKRKVREQLLVYQNELENMLDQN